MSTFFRFIENSIIRQRLRLFMLLMLMMIILFRFRHLLILSSLLRRLRNKIILTKVFLLLKLRRSLKRRSIVQLRFSIRRPNTKFRFCFLNSVTCNKRHRLVPTFTNFRLMFAIYIKSTTCAFPFVLCNSMRRQFIHRKIYSSALCLNKYTSKSRR